MKEKLDKNVSACSISLHSIYTGVSVNTRVDSGSHWRYFCHAVERGTIFLLLYILIGALLLRLVNKNFNRRSIETYVQ